MLDRQDIDALLVGALYGELSPAERTQLEAHLAAHPQDRLALDGLTRTRDAIRDSHVLGLQAEPPAAVSALLLQEAARRAPAPRREARAGFFAGLVALLRHPAMAAASVIILVAGIGGVLYLRGKTDVDATAERSATTAPAGPARQEMTEGATAPAEPAAAAPDQPVGSLTGTAAGSGSSVGVVSLDDGDSRDGAKADEYAGRGKAEEQDRGRASSRAATKSKKGADKARPGYVEVTTPEPTIKEDSNEASFGLRDQRAAGDITTATPKGAGGGGGGKAPADALKKPAATPPVAGNAASAPPAAPATTTDRGESDKKVFAAAQALHRDVVTAVKANNCTRAGQLASTLAARYPDYYVENVRDDRNVKACRAYIEGEVRKRNEAQQKSRSKNSQYDLESPSPRTTSD